MSCVVPRVSMVYTVTSDTGVPGSNPGRDSFLIEGCGFESHFQSAFVTYRPGPDARIALCNGDARSGRRPVDTWLRTMEHVMCPC